MVQPWAVHIIMQSAVGNPERPLFHEVGYTKLVEVEYIWNALVVKKWIIRSYFSDDIELWPKSKTGTFTKNIYIESL